MENKELLEPKNRKELAAMYQISGKLLAKRLKKHGLDFGNDRVLLPSQIVQIIEKLGPWSIPLNSP